MGAALYESRGSSIAEGQESRERSPEVPLTLSNHLVVGAAMQLTFEGVGCELAIFEAGLSRLPRGQRSQWRRSSALRRFCWRRRDWSGSLFKAGALEKLPYRWWMFCDRWCPCRSSTRRSTAIGARASVRKKSACRRVRSASTWGIEGTRLRATAGSLQREPAWSNPQKVVQPVNRGYNFVFNP